MRKYIVITPQSNPLLFERYSDMDFVAIDEGITLAHNHNVKLKMAISDFQKVSLNFTLGFMSKENVFTYSHEPNLSRYEKVINFLIKRGAEEIVILGSFSGKFDHFYNLLLLLKNDKVKISIQDSTNLISYYGEGSHVINRQDYSKISLMGFPEALISMEHVVVPMKKVKIVFGVNRSLNNQILERIAVLKIDSGGVLATLEK